MKKNKYAYLGIGILVLVIISAFILNYLAIWPFGNVSYGQPVYLNEEASTDKTTPTPTNVEVIEADQVVYTTEVVVEGLEIPWSVVFPSNDRYLVTERAGRVREIVNGELLDEPLYEFEEIGAVGEAGAMGMVLDPNYEQNNYLYICYAFSGDNGLTDRVVRFSDSGGGFTDMQVIVDNIPAGQFHAGCELAFGPDNKLYVTTGDATNAQLAQNLSSTAGKILRVNKDGTVPADNPFPDSLVWSYGHRNPQGLDWYPGSSILYASEHGPSGFDGPGGGDEINLIEKGKNYGWPEVSHQESAPDMVSPKVVFTPAIAPSSVAFLDSDRIPAFQNNLFVAMLVGEGIMRFVMNPAQPKEIIMYEKLPDFTYGRIREVTVGPDGFLYFTTSNRDGRGNVQPGDDKLVRIVPF